MYVDNFINNNWSIIFLIITSTDYEGPEPPNESGYHRYQFYLFKQPAEFEIASVQTGMDQIKNVDNGRCRWEFSKFAFTYKLCEALVAAYEYKVFAGRQ